MKFFKLFEFSVTNAGKSILQLFAKSFFYTFLLKLVVGSGVGLYGYGKISEFFDNIMRMFVSNYNSMPSIILAFLDLGGFTAGLEILLSGISFLIGWLSASLALRIAGS